MDTERLSEHVLLAREFDAWQTRNPNRILCDGRELTEDGRLVFYLSINDTTFRLLCPVGYPNHEDSFFVETDCTDFWCVALNEFVVDHRGKLMIDDILSKTYLYHGPSTIDKSVEVSDADDESSDCQSETCTDDSSESNENAEWETAISKMKKEWREKEGELRLRYNRPKISDMFDSVKMDHPRQVFSNSAASAILINDLINVMGSRESRGIVVQPIESDICRWSVLLEKFDPKSKTAKDLYEVKKLYGYEHVQLQLDFAMDSYPSDPPLVRIVRPKLIRAFDGKEFVELANWNPARDMASVLREIKDYIEACGAVDVDNECNGANVNELKIILNSLNDTLNSEPEKAFDDARTESSRTGIDNSTRISPKHCYSPSGYSINNSMKKCTSIETILTTLLDELKNLDKLTSSNTVTKAECPTIYSRFTFNLSVNDNVSDEKIVQPTPKTPSYSSLILNAIDRLTDNEKSKTQTRCTSHQQKTDLGQCCRKNFNITTNPSFEFDYRSRNAVAGFRSKKYSIANTVATKVGGLFNDAYTAVISDSVASEERRKSLAERANDVISTFNANIKTSEGLPVKSSSRNSTSGFNENSSCILKTIKESNLISLIRSKLAADGFFEISLTTYLHSIIIEILIEIARDPHLIDLLKQTDAQGRGIVDLVELQGENVALIIAFLSDIADGRTVKQVDLDKVELAKSVIHASKFLVSKFKATNYRNKESNDRTPTEKSNPGFDDRLYTVSDCPEYVYRNSLKDLHFRNCDIDPESHAFSNEYNAEIDSPRNYFRIAEEFAFLSKILPLSSAWPIFVVTDSSKCSLMRALIIGAEGTCCSGGCFTFDIYLRKDYPDCRMEIKCTTFRGEEIIEQPETGQIRLPFEGDVLDHDHGFSTIFKALTFIRDKKIPIVSTDGGKNYRPSCQNVDPTDGMNTGEVLLTDIIQRSMIDQMREPSSGFEEVIKTHFRLKKDRIISELIDRHESLRNSEILHVLVEEFDRLTRTEINCSSVEKKSNSPSQI